MRLQEILDWSASLAGCDHVPEDSQVYVESPNDVKRVLFGVDIDLAEILWAREQGFDAVIAHHPLGDRARLDFAKVVERQVAQMTAEGVPEERARAAVAARMGPRQRALHMSNVNRIVDTARLIGMPLANVHLACDIIGRQRIVDLLRDRGHAEAKVGDALQWLDELPEIEAGPTRPETWVGEPGNRLGRWTVAMAGGTNGGYPVFHEYFSVGVDTVFAMHIDEGDLQRLRGDTPEGRTLVVTGHMSTDSVGINAVIAGLEEHGIEVVRTSGVVAPG